MTRPVTAPGRLVAGRYRLRSQIGGGGMGAVWLARDERLGRDVAVKQVLSTPGASAEEMDEQRQRALREGRIAARLSHPHASSVYDVALESGQPWLVMEYLPSRSLAAVLTEDGVLRVDQVAQIGAQVADALAATHEAGIVHRDVKPANVLIGEGGSVEGLVKITDFGISHASGDVTLTRTGQITGTPAFLAPEVAQGHPMTEASDVFSLGATLYTCLEGQPPFGMEDNALGMLHRVAGGQIRPPRRAGSLTDPLLRILAADAAGRPSMAEVRDDLATLAAGRDGDTTTVLLARTDLGSGGQGRERTATFAAPAPLPTEDPEPAAPPPPAEPPAPPPPSATPPPPRPADVEPVAATPVRRRPPWALMAFVVVATVVAALVIWLVATRDDEDGGGTADSPTTSAQQSDGGTTSPTTTQQESSASTEQPEPTDQEPPADPAQAATEFFALVPGDLAAAHALTSPGFQEEFPLERFSGFWDGYESVQVSNVEAETGTTALLDITFVEPGGASTTERHRVTFVEGEGGRLLLDSDVIA
jgi:serine/threonine protein kinase